MWQMERNQNQRYAPDRCKPYINISLRSNEYKHVFNVVKNIDITLDVRKERDYHKQAYLIVSRKEQIQ